MQRSFLLARIRKQFEQFQKTELDEFDNKIALHEGNDFQLKAYIHGPKGTIYEGGLFQIDVEYPNEYPFKPPKMIFQTKIWHPNVSSKTGAICLDILGSDWLPMFTIRTALISVQALLSCPQTEDALDPFVCRQYKKNSDIFENHARQWVEKYARYEIYEQKLQELVEMGFSKKDSELALMSCGYSIEEALNQLMK